MPESPSVGETLSPSRATPTIPQTQVDRREESQSTAIEDPSGRSSSVSRISHRVFLRMELTPELDELMANLAQCAGGYPEMIRTSLGLLKIAQEAHRENKRLVVIDDEENSEQEITL